jgi:hypothetical protein
VLWAPDAEPSRPSESRSLWALLEWLARYPNQVDALPGLAPVVGDAIAVMVTANSDVDDALETIRQRGGMVRAWVVGDAELGAHISVRRAGLEWPLL